MEVTPSMRALNARFWFLVTVGRDTCPRRFRDDVLSSQSTGTGSAVRLRAAWAGRRSSRPLSVVCLLPALQPSTRAAMLAVPGRGGTHKTFPLSSEYTKPPWAAEAILSAEMMTTLEFLETFFTALPKHLNDSRRCSSVCLRWFIKMRTHSLISRVVEVQTLSKNSHVF